tara:strand:- start:3748 stop:4935 length:1188 start_codon:yes stop_codon:yes gene_type:complete
MILIVSALFPPEPTVSAAISYDIADALGQSGKTVVISPEPTRPLGMKYDQENYKKNIFDHIVVNSFTCPESSVVGRLRESYSFGIKLKNYITENHHDIEVVYANTWPMFSQFILARVCRKYGVPYVLHVQDIYPESLTVRLGLLNVFFTKLLLPIDRYILSNAKQVITISSQMKSNLIGSRKLDSKHLAVVRNWQDDSLFISDDCLIKSVDCFTFMFVGTVNKTANVDHIVRAFGELNPLNAKLIIAGDGPDRDRVLSIAKNYSANIEFINVSPSEVPGLQRQANVLILALKKGVGSTALPSKLTAYLYSSRPVLVSVDTLSETASIIRDNECGWAVESENIEAFKKALNSIFLLSSDELITMGRNGLEYATNNLSKKNNLNKMVGLILNSRRKL